MHGLQFPAVITCAAHRLRLEAARALAGHGDTAQLDDARMADAAARAGCAPLVELSRRLSLAPIDELVLLAAIAFELDPAFAILASALGGEEPRAGLSQKLLAQILHVTGDDGFALRIWPGHPLVEAALLDLAPGSEAVPYTLRPFRAPERVIAYLLGDGTADRLLARAGSLVEVPATADFAHATAALELLERLLATDDVVVCIEGAEGVGRRTLAAAAARKLGRPVLALDAGRLATSLEPLHAELRALTRETWLRGAIPVLARIDALPRNPPERLGAVVALLDAHVLPGAVAITSAIGAELPEFRRRVVRVRVDSPGADARLQIWSRAIAIADRAPLAEIAQRYSLTPGAIERAAANAHVVAGDRAPEIADVRQGIAIEIQERFGGIATPLHVHHRWDDLVLPQDTYDDIRAFVSRAQNATTVYERWGFRDKLQRGLGLAALFSGPPGTGKTMVAGLIAQSLHLQLYLVDLSQVLSKWVGETEKQLGKIFDAAQAGQALLLFDEADALFAKRTEVKSSNDRYANLEVNYLLQRVESFGGVAILTTNLEASVDPAFKRRLAADVHFYPPERDERLRLWKSLVPRAAPLDPEVDFASLEDDDMCGGHIRNAMLRAAFLAAAEDTAITQQHLERAVRSEYRAMGKVDRD